MTRLIMFSTDAHLLDEGSAVRARMGRYAGLGYELSIILFSPRRAELFALANDAHDTHGARVYPVYARLKPVAFAKALALVLRLAGPDDVITAQDPFEIGLLALIASRLRGSALHIQIHIDFYSRYFRAESLRQRFQAWLAPRVIKRADGVRAVSKKIAAHCILELGLDESAVMAVPVFVDAAAVDGTPATVDLRALYPQFDFIFLVASRWVQQKNIPLAIRAFGVFARSHPRAGLVVIGSGGEEASIRRVVSDLKLSNSVVMAPLTGAFISAMKTCEAFLLTSDYEGWGMTVVEAAACGRSVIMTDVGCAGEFINDGENGLVVPPRDQGALVGAMEKVYSDRALAARLGGRARISASAYMTIEQNDSLMKASWDAARNL